MPRSAKSNGTLRAVAVPMAWSLALHGLLFLALWFWPNSQPSPKLTIESTRITLDTCVLEPQSSVLGPERERLADIAFTPQLREATPLTSEPPVEAGPTLVQEPPSRAPVGSSEESSNEPVASGGGSGSDLFPLPAKATSVVYVLDRSVSMGMDHKLDFARRELIAGLRRLPASMRFQVIDYNDSAESLVVDGNRDLLLADPATVDKAVAFLLKLDAAGNTNHLAALRRAVDFHADAIYFLTDADDLKPQEIALITQRNRQSVIHTLELTRRRSIAPDGPLAQLARDNNGIYRRVLLSE